MCHVLSANRMLVWRMVLEVDSSDQGKHWNEADANGKRWLTGNMPEVANQVSLAIFFTWKNLGNVCWNLGFKSSIGIKWSWSLWEDTADFFYQKKYFLGRSKNETILHDRQEHREIVFYQMDFGCFLEGFDHCYINRETVRPSFPCVSW